LPRAPNFSNTDFFTSSNLVSLPVVSRLRGWVCLDTTFCWKDK